MFQYHDPDHREGRGEDRTGNQHREGDQEEIHCQTELTAQTVIGAMHADISQHIDEMFVVANTRMILIQRTKWRTAKMMLKVST